jgi:hypothetical protein
MLSKLIYLLKYVANGNQYAPFSLLLFFMKDGFFDGELLDGRRGLVPSNFIQKLVGEDLLEFHQAVVQGLRDGDDSGSTNIAHDLAQEALALMG